MPEDPILVTTRSRLRDRRHIPFMLTATRRIVKELGGTEGAQQVVSIIASPREFWTVSVWSTRHLMQEFMRSGAHGTYLWEVSNWLESFWLMRWRPTRHELGDWSGRTLAPVLRDVPVPPIDAAVRDQVLAAIPSLRSAFGPGGAPTYDASPEARYHRDLVAGSAGVLLRMEPGTGARGRQALQDLRASLHGDRDLLRAVTGRGQREGGAYLLGVWTSAAAANRFLDSEPIAALHARMPGAFWACELAPDNEFGHWDGMRLRDLGEHGHDDVDGTVRP